jgi:phosphoenolpyruvate synthase/pyruvate phosphate dikinase
MPQSVFFFGNGQAEGTRTMKSVLGGKGANLAEMTNLGVPVPPGFTIAASVCIAYLRDGKYTDRLRAEVEGNIARLEDVSGRKFGDPKNPLLVSVRSGAAVSMPGMMETILNLGLNDRTALGLAKQSNNPRFAYDSYRRFIQMYADVVMGVPSGDFEHLLKARRHNRNALRPISTAWRRPQGTLTALFRCAPTAPDCCYRESARVSSRWPHAWLPITSAACISHCTTWSPMLPGATRRSWIGY